MPINASLSTTDYTVQDLFDILDFITVDASVTSVTSTGFRGSGFLNGAQASFVATGSGLQLGAVNGETIVSSGTVKKVVFSGAEGKIVMTSLGVKMEDFAPVIVSDLNGASPFAIEKFLMREDWNVTLGSGDDEAGKGTLVGDGIALNLRGDDIINGKGGNDNLFTGHGKDVLKGGSGSDILNGGAGKDRVDGGKGNDDVIGEKGADTLKGGGGNDNLFGGKGNDRIIGGKGADEQTGGGGSDVFVFKSGHGVNGILDFDAKDNAEQIDLSGVSSIKNWNDLKNDHLEKVDGIVVINDGNGLEVFLENVSMSDLNKADFIF